MASLKPCVFLKLSVKSILVLASCPHVINEYRVFFVPYSSTITSTVSFMIFNVGSDNEAKITPRSIFGVTAKKEKERLRIWKNLLRPLENVWRESTLASYSVSSESWFARTTVRALSIHTVGVLVTSCGLS